MCRVYLESSSGAVYDGCIVDVKEGDTVGCGFEPTDRVDASSGIPCAHQTLTIYFTVNGNKVRATSLSIYRFTAPPNAWTLTSRGDSTSVLGSSIRFDCLSITCIILFPLRMVVMIISELL